MNIRNFLTVTAITASLFLTACATPISPSTVNTINSDAAAVAPVIAPLATTSAVQSVLNDVNSSKVVKETASLCADAISAQSAASNLLKGGAANTVAKYSNLVTYSCNDVSAIQAIAKNPTTGNFLLGLKDALNTAEQISAVFAKH